jgi:hypothetical protein
MREDEDAVRAWITRNEGFRPSDDAFFAKLGVLLGGLSSDGNGEQPP